MSKSCKIYFAAPLFTQAEWQWNRRLSEALRRRGFDVTVPQRRVEPMLSGRVPFNDKEIFNANLTGLDECDVVLAILDQADPDSGTSWECGYAYKLGRPIIGLRTDMRQQGDVGCPINLMLFKSARHFIIMPGERINDMRWIVEQIYTAIGRVI